MIRIRPPDYPRRLHLLLSCKMHTAEPTTITELLTLRAGASNNPIHFLGDSGDVTSTLTFVDLAESAKCVAKALLASGLQSGGKDIVVTKLDEQRTHILLFWGCAFGQT